MRLTGLPLLFVSPHLRAPVPRAIEVEATWEDVPWEEADRPLQEPGVLLEVDDAAELLQPELGPLVEADCTALLESANLPDTQLSVTLCDDDAIRGAASPSTPRPYGWRLPATETPAPVAAVLNNEWRDKDKPTDVLSFPMDDEVMLGDIVVSVETAARQAAERGYGVRDEVRVLLVHGLLHLLGYDHDLSEEDHAEHAEAEQKLMGRLGWNGDGLVAAVGAS